MLIFFFNYLNKITKSEKRKENLKGQIVFKKRTQILRANIVSNSLGSSLDISCLPSTFIFLFYLGLSVLISFLNTHRNENLTHIRFALARTIYVIVLMQLLLSPSSLFRLFNLSTIYKKWILRYYYNSRCFNTK